MREADPPISLALVGTIHGRFTDHPVDDLITADSATIWLRANGFPATPDLTDDEAYDLRSLREAIFAILTAQTTGAEQSPHVVSELDNALHRSHDCFTIEIDPHDPRRLIAVDQQGNCIDTILHRIADDTLSLTVGVLADRVHQCTAHTCGTFFVDTSRAGNRKWCSASTCGNRARVKAHRGRGRDEAPRA